MEKPRDYQREQAGRVKHAIEIHRKPLYQHSYSRRDAQMIKPRRIFLSLGPLLILKLSAYSQTNDTAAIKQAALNYGEWKIVNVLWEFLQ